jgi:CubicO group peptidase (beta-lactamase class C family)
MDAVEAVNIGNWRKAPWSRWAFQNVDSLIPVAPIPAKPGAQPLPPGAPLADRLPDGTSLDAALRETETDGFLVLQDGKVRMEWYANGLGPKVPHIVFSVSKSISAILAGILVGQGKLDPEAPVARYIPEVAGSAYDDCTVRHVLDMTVNIDFVEDYLDPNGPFARYRIAMGWNPVPDPASAPDLHGFMVTLPHGTGRHGERFHYVSPNSDLLGWIIERASGRPYAALLSEAIWQPLGAETDGIVTIDKSGAARSAGGICVTLRDLARFGEMLRQDGKVGDRQVVPASWIADIRENGDPGAWARGDMAFLLPGGRYRSKWYVTDNAHGAYTAIGIHGQWLYIDPKARMVIAKLSSQALPVDDPIDHRLLKLFADLGAALV